MKRLDVRLVFGAVLVLAGLLFLLDNLGVLAGAGDLFWAALFAVGGAAFLYRYATDRMHWWALIPGFTLLGLAAVIALEALPLGDTGAISGGIFLGAIGLAFWAIYLTRRDFWWALIPGGVLVTLGVVAALAEKAQGEAVGGIFFLGLAATFGGLYFLPTPQGRQTWAAIPAVILGAMGVFLLVGAAVSLSYVLPAALILAGLVLLWRALVPRGGA
ncbi:MAG: hypothetical protein H5T65_10790 [Chloroflexi bacterium]|nr:hypothetical protein [Chloroflexota bacterium]